MEIKSSEPKLKQKETSKQLEFSDSIIKLYRDDINTDKLYNRKKYKKKKN